MGVAITIPIHPSFVGSRSPSPPPRVRILLGNVVTIALPPTGIVPACAASPLPAATAERAERVQNGREERTTLLLLSNAIADRAHEWPGAVAASKRPRRRCEEIVKTLLMAVPWQGTYIKWEGCLETDFKIQISPYNDYSTICTY